MRRLIGAVLLIVGAAIFILGIGSASWWKPPTEIEATTHSTSTAGIIATEPGVLELVDNEVEVTASAPGTRVDMVVARTERARLWLGQTPYVSVTGLEDWETLKTEDPAEPAKPAEPEESEDPENTEESDEALELEGSDLFIPENFFTGEDHADVTLSVPEGDFSLIAVSADGTTPSLTLTWHRQVETPLTMPLIISGIILAAAGAALFMYDSQSRRASTRRQDRSDMWVADAKIPTDRAEATGRAYGAAIIPASPRATELRGRELAEEDRIIITPPTGGLMAEDGEAESAERADELGEQPDEVGENADRAEATGRAYGAAIIPASPRATELRGRELAEEDRIIIPAEDEADESRAADDVEAADEAAGDNNSEQVEPEQYATIQDSGEEAAAVPQAPLLPLQPMGRIDGEAAEAPNLDTAERDGTAEEVDTHADEAAAATDEDEFAGIEPADHETVSNEPTEGVDPDQDQANMGQAEDGFEVGSSEESEAAVERGEASGRAYGAGIIPASPRAHELRGRELTDDNRIIIPEAIPAEEPADVQRDAQAEGQPEDPEQAELESPEAAAIEREDATDWGGDEAQGEQPQAEATEAEAAEPEGFEHSEEAVDSRAEDEAEESDGWEQPQAIWPAVDGEQDAPEAPQTPESGTTPDEEAPELPEAEEVHLDDTPEQEEATPVRRQYNWRKLWGFGSKEEE
ncbi:MAG: hypothetical protein Q4P33_00655 [Flaviflexus sp.]|nr:hypothetical protein [Flaviflexus sp.]